MLSYGSQMYAFNGGNPTYYGAYAYCPNNTAKWQKVPDTYPLKYQRNLASEVLVPITYLNLPYSTCSPSNYQCS